MEQVMPPKKLIAIRMDPYLIEYVDKIAIADQRSRSQVIRMILSQHVVDHP